MPVAYRKPSMTTRTTPPPLKLAFNYGEPINAHRKSTVKHQRLAFWNRPIRTEAIFKFFKSALFIQDKTLHAITQKQPFRNARYRLIQLPKGMPLLGFRQPKKLLGMVIAYPPKSTQTSQWKKIAHIATQRAIMLGNLRTKEAQNCIEVRQGDFTLYLVNPAHIQCQPWLNNCQNKTIEYALNAERQTQRQTKKFY